MDACEKYGITISTFWYGWSGPRVWDFMEGFVILELVPVDYRNERIKDLKKGSDYAKKVGDGESGLVQWGRCILTHIEMLQMQKFKKN